MSHDEQRVVTDAAAADSEPSPTPRELELVVTALIRRGQLADARRVLQHYAVLQGNQPLNIDLIYAEYCQRRENGAAVDPEEFYTRYPTFRTALREILVAEEILAGPVQPPSPPPAEVRWPKVGQDFLGFTLLRELGRGGIARVYLATQTEVGGRQVVLKVAPQGAAEANILGRLSHPHIVPIHSVHTDEDSGLTAVCMPYRGSATLADVLRNLQAADRLPTRAQFLLDAVRDPLAGDTQPARPSWRRRTYVDGVLHIGAQLAEALASVHAHDIFHRDLKPSNVLMGPDGCPMLLDFNLSADAHMPTLQWGGTLPYMPPEQLRALGSQDAAPPLEARSDLFALAVILWELLTGTHPFGPIPADASLAEQHRLLLERQEQRVASLRSLNPAVDAALATALERCLAWDCEQRLSSATELARLLRGGLSPVRRLRRWVGRHRYASVAGVVLALAVGLLSGLALAMRPPYAVRQWHEGQAAAKSGHYQQAVDCYTQALAVHPNQPQWLLARALAHQRLGEPRDLMLARIDYDLVYRQCPDGRTKACLGYCFSRLGEHLSALAKYEDAQRDGFATAEVYNNIGYTCLYLPAGLQPRAKPALDEAIRLNPRLQAAYHNRAQLYLNQGLQQPNRIPEEGIADVRRAIELGPGSGELYRTAARLYTIAARQRTEFVEPALDCVEQAIAHGSNPAELGRQPFLTPLSSQPRFRALVSQPAPAGPPSKAVRLLDPLPGEVVPWLPAGPLP